MKQVSNWIEGMSLELKRKERIEHIKQQLTAKGHLDGWMIEGLEKELKELESNERVSGGKT
tara:strand:+ start:4318 stop:4500 length:183 start_codon:yes stop_codon:yes gene_type:complete